MNDLILHTFLRTSELKSINGFTPNLRVTDPRWIRYMMLESKSGVMSTLIFWVTNLLVSWFSWLHTQWCPIILSGYTRTCNYTCVLKCCFHTNSGNLILLVTYWLVSWYCRFNTYLFADILGYTLTCALIFWVTHLLHTYSVWQPIPLQVYLCWNRHPKIAKRAKSSLWDNCHSASEDTF